MKLRWLNKQYRSPTAAEVRAHAAYNDLSIVEAMRALRPPNIPSVLQLWDDVNQCWETVPTEVEIIE